MYIYQDRYTVYISKDKIQYVMRNLVDTGLGKCLKNKDMCTVRNPK